MGAVARRVLVVDDDPAIRTLIQEALEDDGFEVLSAPDGRAALELVDGFAPDVILLDLNMPVMDGPTFAAAYARRAPVAWLAPIVVVSAAVDGAAWAGRLGAAGYLRKPFDLDKLSERVATLAKRDVPPTPAHHAAASLLAGHAA
jgi:CheY-like chemotaxis protein